MKFNLKAAREKLQLTQAELGEKLDVDKNTIARWERGEVGIQHPRILGLALDRLSESIVSGPCGRCERPQRAILPDRCHYCARLLCGECWEAKGNTCLACEAERAKREA